MSVRRWPQLLQVFLPPVSIIVTQTINYVLPYYIRFLDVISKTGGHEGLLPEGVVRISSLLSVCDLSDVCQCWLRSHGDSDRDPQPGAFAVVLTWSCTMRCAVLTHIVSRCITHGPRTQHDAILHAVLHMAVALTHFGVRDARSQPHNRTCSSHYMLFSPHHNITTSTAHQHTSTPSHQHNLS